MTKTNLIVAITILSLFALPGFGQREQSRRGQSPVATAGLPSSRYEIIGTFDSNEIPTTFRLDKFTGRVYRLDYCERGRPCWKELSPSDLPKFSDTKVRYQLFLNAGPFMRILLIEIDSGQTWSLGGEKGSEKWFPFLEP